MTAPHVAPRGQRVVLWVAALLVIGGLLGRQEQAINAARDAAQKVEQISMRSDFEIRRESQLRTGEVCRLIIDMNEANRLSVRRERESLQSTLSYLRSNERDAPALRARVKDNLPNVRARLAQAKTNFRATSPPPSCAIYQPQE